MTDVRIKGLPAATSIADDDVLAVDSTTLGARSLPVARVTAEAMALATQAAAQANSATSQANAARDAANQATTTANQAAATANDASERAEAAIDAVGDVTELAVPLMSAGTRGGAKLGTGLKVEDGTLSLGDIVTDSCDGPIYSVDAEGWSEQASTVGKNLLPNNGTSQTISGVTFTVNADGSVTVNGTNSTSNILLYIIGQCALTEGSAYTLSGCPTSGGTTKAFLQLAGYGDDVGNGYSITARANALTPNAQIRVAANATVSNLTFYPMLEPGSTATEWEPYSGAKPSPSPEFPQTIEVCRGRNLLPDDFSFAGTGVTQSSKNGESDYSWTATSVSGGSGSIQHATSLTYVGSTYVLSFKAKAASAMTIHAEFNGGNGGDASVGTSWTDCRIPITRNNQYNYLFIWPNTTNVAIRVKDIQLELGSTPTPYVPYGHVGLDVQGRNLCALFENNAYSGSNGTPIYASNYVRTGKIDSPGVCTVSYGKDATATMLSWDENGSFIGKVDGSYNVRSATFTPPQNAAKIAFNFYANGLTADNIGFVQIERGTTATPYEPYYHTTTHIPLPSKGWAGAVGDYADALSVDSAGKWEWTCATDEVVFDGSSDENWSVYNSGSENWYYKIASGYVYSNRQSILSNRYSDASVGNANTAQGICLIDVGDFRIRYGTEDTVLNYKTWLSTHNVTVLYPLATTTTEHGYVDLPMDIPVGASIDIPELRECGVKCFLPAVKELAIHAANWGQRAKEQEARIEALEEAIATIVTA